MGEPAAEVVGAEVVEEIEFCLKKILDKRREKDLYNIILRLWLYQDMSPEKIHENIQSARSVQRIRNIITESKKELQKCLKGRGISTK